MKSGSKKVNVVTVPKSQVDFKATTTTAIGEKRKVLMEGGVKPKAFMSTSKGSQQQAIPKRPDGDVEWDL